MTHVADPTTPTANPAIPTRTMTVASYPEVAFTLPSSAAASLLLPLLPLDSAGPGLGSGWRLQPGGAVRERCGAS